MDNARKVAEFIHNDNLNKPLNKEGKLQRTTKLIGYYVGDIIKTINDIQKTSLNEDDAYIRLSELSEKCGIKLILNIKI